MTVDSDNHPGADSDNRPGADSDNRPGAGLGYHPGAGLGYHSEVGRRQAFAYLIHGFRLYSDLDCFDLAIFEFLTCPQHKHSYLFAGIGLPPQQVGQ